MVALTTQEKQVVEAYRALDPARRRQVLLEMARAGSDDWKRFQGTSRARFQELARKQGLNWEQMDDQQRQDFIEEFLER